MKAIYSHKRFGEHGNLDVKRYLPSKNLPLYSASCPLCSGEFAGSVQIAFTKREVELVGGAPWNMFQFDYLKSTLGRSTALWLSPGWMQPVLGFH